MLYLRILSALIGIPVIIGAVYFGGPWYAMLILLIVNLGIYEYNKILKAGNYYVPLVVNYLGVTLFIVVIFFEKYALILPLVMFLFFVLFTFTLLNMETINITDSALALWGIIYLGGLCGYLLMLRMLPDGAFFTYILLAGVWLNDTLAYFIGVKWGSRLFAPQISPKKSLEGSLAGISGTVLIFFSGAILLPNVVPLSPVQAILLALGITVFAQLGDLMESALKRQLQVKDSGGIIPGHGGILDRFDSMMLAAPFVYYAFTLFDML